jgi:putative ABC transport system ATP-binding protein
VTTVALPDQPLAVDVQDVHLDFDDGAITALDGVSLSVGVGECVGITGPSGCGKSTLLHLLAGLDTPTSGRLVVAGQDLSALDDPALFRRTQVGLVFQLHNLIPHLTARQNVEVAMLGTGRPRADRRRRALELLADVDLAACADRPPTKLSGGERQRVALARALANEPRVLLADEPTGNLDVAGVHRFIALRERLRQQRPELAVVVVTHDDRVASATDRVVRLEDGRVLTSSVSGS